MLSQYVLSAIVTLRLHVHATVSCLPSTFTLRSLSPSGSLSLSLFLSLSLSLSLSVSFDLLLSIALVSFDFLSNLLFVLGSSVLSREVDDVSPFVFSFYRTSADSVTAPPTRQRKPCNCSKSQCLKLYVQFVLPRATGVKLE